MKFLLLIEQKPFNLSSSFKINIVLFTPSPKSLKIKVYGPIKRKSMISFIHDRIHITVSTQPVKIIKLNLLEKIFTTEKFRDFETVIYRLILFYEAYICSTPSIPSLTVAETSFTNASSSNLVSESSDDLVDR